MTSEDLEKLLEEGPGENGSVWAAIVCKVGRRAHIDVWLHHRPADYVKHLIVLLSQLADFMPATEESDVYKRNTLTRVKSLKSYLEGGLPIVPEEGPAEEHAIVPKALSEYVDQNPPKQAVA